MFVGHPAYARVLVFVVCALWEEAGVAEVPLSRRGDSIAIKVSSLGFFIVSVQGKQGMIVCLGWHFVVYVSS